MEREDKIQWDLSPLSPQTLGGPGALRLPTVGNLKGMTKDERK